MTIIASDDFHRADAANLGSNWTTGPTDVAIAIATNEARMTSASTNGHQYWSGAGTFPGDQFCEITVGSLVEPDADNGVYAGVRELATGNPYPIYIFGGGFDLRVYKRLNDGSGNFVQLGSTSGSSVVTGDKLYLEANGTTITAKVNRGAPICGTPVTDSQHSTGQPMLDVAKSSGDPRVSLWTAGDLTNDSLLSLATLGPGIYSPPTYGLF